MFSQPVSDRKQVLNDMLRRGVRLQDLETLKDGEQVYLWERDIATLRELNEFTGRGFWKIYRICNKKRFLLIADNQTSMSRKRLLGGMKYPIRHVVPIEGYAKFVEWRQGRLDFVVKQTGIDIFGRCTLEKMIRTGEIKVASIDIEGKKNAGISRKCLERQIVREINRLREYLDSLSYDRNPLLKNREDHECGDSIS